MIPLLFMGDEVAAEQPFLFFTSHHGELAELVREGRRNEFKAFSAFADPQTRERIPDPNAASTFEASRPSLEPQRAEQQASEALYRQLLKIRREEIVPRLPGAQALGADVLGNGAVCARWRLGDGSVLRIDLNLGDQPVEHHAPEEARILFEHPQHVMGLLQQGVLAPHSALVSLTQATTLPNITGERL